MFLEISSLFGEMIQFDYVIFFQMGWNHQLEDDSSVILFRVEPNRRPERQKPMVKRIDRQVWEFE